MSNEMYFDPTSFDFTSLVDVVEAEPETAKTYTKAADVNQDGGIIDDASDLADLFMSDEDETEAGEIDPNDDVSDLAMPTEDAADKITIFNDLPDDTPLVFEGQELTKSQVKQLFEDKQNFESQKEFISTAANSLDQIHRYIQQNHTAHALSIDTNIANIQRKMNSNISATEYGEEARKLNQALEARAMLNARVDEEMKLLDVQRAETTRFRVLQADQAMRAEVKEWDQIKGGLLKDMQDRGVNLGELEKIWSKDVALMALNDYRYRKQKKLVGDKALEAAKAKAPRSTSTAANAKREKSLDAQAAKKQALVAKAKKGELTPQEHSEMYNYLVD
ncbi:hypothetical protein GAV44_23355 [Salmonella enterica subsp. enterica serovar Newport]|nr:hypothetical protein [Salmonella enterica subsp. enterica serovar Newport]